MLSAQTVARRLLQASGLPSLEPVRPDPEHEEALDLVADRLVGGDSAALDAAPLARLDVLRWLAARRDVLFHGSSRDDLELLEPIRLSRDTTTFGDQQAVYATDDPVWAIYFAILRRQRPFATRNGVMAVSDETLGRRWYSFSVLPPLDPDARFGSGSLYVLPRRSFVRQPPLLGAIDTAQWVSRTRVRPFVRVGVTTEDFPLLDTVVTHSEREPMLFTLGRVAFANRRRRPRRRR